MSRLITGITFIAACPSTKTRDRIPKRAIRRGFIAKRPKGDAMTGRLTMLAVTIGLAAALIVTIILEPLPLNIWNASASAPIGLYRLRPADQFQVIEFFAVQPPEPVLLSPERIGRPATISTTAHPFAGFINKASQRFAIAPELDPISSKRRECW